VKTTDTISTNGMITKKLNQQYWVAAGEQTFVCAAPLLPTGKPGRSRPLDAVVGDQVRLELAPDGRALLAEVLPRRNWLSRRSAIPMPGAHAHEQMIAANVDQLAPVFAVARPAPKWNLLDRYLALAEAQEIPALVCITKLDLASDAAGAVDDEIVQAAADYRRIGYTVILTSSHTGAGVDELRQALQGKLTVLLGKSGVGKTALLNAVQPGLGQRVGAVSQVTGKGKHTTTHLEMFPLEGGGALVDTPGTREFGLWDIEPDELAFCFREIRPWLGRCRFGMGCNHDQEPGCAVRQAVTQGQISPRRYQNYLNLKTELTFT
jgi:ribosome biogenesis GTPase / thiamine phosphate phosphatase